MSNIPEKDWKRARAMKDELLTIACERILSKVRAIADAKNEASHDAYLKLWEVMRAEDEKIAIMFNDLRRSNAVQKLSAWRRFGILTDEQLAQFTEETQEAVNVFREF
jgi:hypothetical protein